MAGISIESIFALMTKNKLDPSAKIEFRLGECLVKPESVVVVHTSGYYNGPGPGLEVRISSEWIDAQVRKRMKEMYAAHVDATFCQTEKTDLE